MRCLLSLSWSFDCLRHALCGPDALFQAIAAINAHFSPLALVLHFFPQVDDASILTYWLWSPEDFSLNWSTDVTVPSNDSTGEVKWQWYPG